MFVAPLPHDNYIDAVAHHLTRLGHEPAQWWTETPDGEQLDGVIIFGDTANPDLWAGRVWLGWDQRVGWSLCDDTRTLFSLGVGRYAAPEAVATRAADRLTGRPDTVVDVGWDGAEALAEAVWKWENSETEQPRDVED